MRIDLETPMKLLRRLGVPSVIVDLVEDAADRLQDRVFGAAPRSQADYGWSPPPSGTAYGAGMDAPIDAAADYTEPPPDPRDLYGAPSASPPAAGKKVPTKTAKTVETPKAAKEPRTAKAPKAEKAPAKAAGRGPGCPRKQPAAAAGQDVTASTAEEAAAGKPALAEKAAAKSAAKAPAGPKARAPKKAPKTAEAPTLDAIVWASTAPAGNDPAAWSAYFATLPETSQRFLQLVEQHGTLAVEVAVGEMGLKSGRSVGGITGAMIRWAPKHGITVPFVAHDDAEGNRVFVWQG